MKRLLAIVLLLAAGCGEDEPAPAPVTVASTPAPTVAAADRDRLRSLEARIQRHCVAVSRSLVDPADAPTPEQATRAFAAADDLIAMVRADPRSDLGAGQDLRLYLSDVIENLQGSNCDPRMLDRLRQGRGTIP